MKNLKRLRTSKNLKQSDLAAFFHVSQTAISEWEKGTKDTSVEQMCAVADYFGVTVDYLLGREPESGLIYLHKDPELTEEERELLFAYQKISPELRESAIHILRSLGKIDQKN